METTTRKPNGATIKRIRALRGVGQKAVAREAKMSGATLADLELERTNNPHPSTIRKLAEALGVQTEVLYLPPEEAEETVLSPLEDGLPDSGEGDPVLANLKERAEDHIERWGERLQSLDAFEGEEISGDVLALLVMMRSDATRDATYLLRDLRELGAEAGLEPNVFTVVRAVTDAFRGQVDRIVAEREAALAEFEAELVNALAAEDAYRKIIDFTSERARRRSGEQRKARSA